MVRLSCLSVLHVLSRRQVQARSQHVKLPQAGSAPVKSPGLYACVLQWRASSSQKASPRAGSHCDFETITLLFAHGPGLEVCPGRWALWCQAPPCFAGPLHAVLTVQAWHAASAAGIDAPLCRQPASRQAVMCPWMPMHVCVYL